MSQGPSQNIQQKNIQQVWYTWSFAGLGSLKGGGFRIRAASPELLHSSGRRLEVLASYLHYTLPPGTRRSSLSQDAAPVCLSLLRIENDELVLVNKVYVEKDGMGRNGVYSSHMLANLPGDFAPGTAIGLWRSTFWEIGDDTQRGIELDNLSLDDIQRRFISVPPFRLPEREQVRRYLPTFIHMYLQQESEREQGRDLPIYIAAPCDVTAYYIHALTRCLPARLLEKLTFSTFEPEVLVASGCRIIGTCDSPAPNAAALKFADLLPPECNRQGLALNYYAQTLPARLLENELYQSFAVFAAGEVSRNASNGLLQKLLQRANDRRADEAPLTVATFLERYNRYTSRLKNLSRADVVSILKDAGETIDLLPLDSVHKQVIASIQQDPAWLEGGLEGPIRDLCVQATQDRELREALEILAGAAWDGLVSAARNHQSDSFSALFRLAQIIWPPTMYGGKWKALLHNLLYSVQDHFSNEQDSLQAAKIREFIDNNWQQHEELLELFTVLWPLSSTRLVRDNAIREIELYKLLDMSAAHFAAFLASSRFNTVYKYFATQQLLTRYAPASAPFGQTLPSHMYDHVAQLLAYLQESPTANEESREERGKTAHGFLSLLLKRGALYNHDLLITWCDARLPDETEYALTCSIDILYPCTGKNRQSSITLIRKSFEQTGDITTAAYNLFRLLKGTSSTIVGTAKGIDRERQYVISIWFSIGLPGTTLHTLSHPELFTEPEKDFILSKYGRSYLASADTRPFFMNMFDQLPLQDYRAARKAILENWLQDPPLLAVWEDLFGTRATSSEDRLSNDELGFVLATFAPDHLAAQSFMTLIVTRLVSWVSRQQGAGEKVRVLGALLERVPDEAVLAQVLQQQVVLALSAEEIQLLLLTTQGMDTIGIVKRFPDSQTLVAAYRQLQICATRRAQLTSVLYGWRELLHTEKVLAALLDIARLENDEIIHFLDYDEQPPQAPAHKHIIHRFPRAQSLLNLLARLATSQEQAQGQVQLFEQRQTAKMRVIRKWCAVIEDEQHLDLVFAQARLARLSGNAVTLNDARAFFRIVAPALIAAGATLNHDRLLIPRYHNSTVLLNLLEQLASDADEQSQAEVKALSDQWLALWPVADTDMMKIALTFSPGTDTLALATSKDTMKLIADFEPSSDKYMFGAPIAQSTMERLLKIRSHSIAEQKIFLHGRGIAYLRTYPQSSLLQGYVLGYLRSFDPKAFNLKPDRPLSVKVLDFFHQMFDKLHKNDFLPDVIQVLTDAQWQAIWPLVVRWSKVGKFLSEPVAAENIDEIHDIVLLLKQEVTKEVYSVLEAMLPRAFSLYVSDRGLLYLHSAMMYLKGLFPTRQVPEQLLVMATCAQEQYVQRKASQDNYRVSILKPYVQIAPALPALLDELPADFHSQVWNTLFFDNTVTNNARGVVGADDLKELSNFARVTDKAVLPLWRNYVNSNRSIPQQILSQENIEVRNVQLANEKQQLLQKLRTAQDELKSWEQNSAQEKNDLRQRIMALEEARVLLQKRSKEQAGTRVMENQSLQEQVNTITIENQRLQEQVNMLSAKMNAMPMPSQKRAMALQETNALQRHPQSLYERWIVWNALLHIWWILHIDRSVGRVAALYTTYQNLLAYYSALQKKHSKDWELIDMAHRFSKACEEYDETKIMDVSSQIEQLPSLIFGLHPLRLTRFDWERVNAARKTTEVQ